MTEIDAMEELKQMEKTLLKLMKNDTPLANKDDSLTSIFRRVTIDKTILPTERHNAVKYFFTRPRVNLSRSTLIVDRILSKLNKTIGDSIEKSIRLLLDPSLGYKRANTEYVENNIIRNDEPFITVLSNAVNTVSGHPDPIIESFTSKEGLYKEQVSHIEGTDKLFGAWYATINFTNLKGEGVWLLLDTWIRYSVLVKAGKILPYSRYLLGRQVDYQSGLFTLVLGDDNRTIKHIASTIVFPTALSKGKLFDSMKDVSKRAGVEDISVRFRCIGAEYDDPITAFEFNKHVASFAGSLRNYIHGDIRGSEYVVVPPNIYSRFNDRCIPFIDLKYGKLEWLVHKDDVEELSKEFYELLN